MLIGEQEPEHKYPWSWQRWMRLARSEGLFVVDLAQPSQIVASSSEQVDGFDFRVVEVDLGVGSVRFYVRQVGSRWRISQIVGDGAAYGGPGLLRPGDVRLPCATETNCPPSPGLSFLPTERIRLETGEIVVVSDNDQVVVVGTG